MTSEYSVFGDKKHNKTIKKLNELRAQYKKFNNRKEYLVVSNLMYLYLNNDVAIAWRDNLPVWLYLEKDTYDSAAKYTLNVRKNKIVRNLRELECDHCYDSAEI